MNGAELSAFGRRLLERAESHQLTASADEVSRSPAQGLGSSDRLGAGQAHPAMAMEPVGVDDLGVVRGLDDVAAIRALRVGPAAGPTSGSSSGGGSSRRWPWSSRRAR